MDTEEKEIKIENLVKLDPNQRDFYRLAEGKLVYVDHPEKGIVWADNMNVFINTIELTEEEKSRLGQPFSDRFR